MISRPMPSAKSVSPDTSTYITINGIAINQAIIGTGKPLLMLHGWGANIKLLQPFAERFAPLGYQIYMPDLPGFGQTPPAETAWSVHDYVKFVITYMDTHQLDKLYLFGHSFGGRLGLVLGAEYADRFIKIALADSAGVRSQPSSSSHFRLKTYRLALNTLKWIGLSAQADQLRAWYANRYGSADYKAAQGVMRETFVKVVNEDLLPFAARIKIPTLLFWGDHDEDTPLSQGQILEKTIPDAGLIVLKGAGHYSYLDNLSETVKIMDYFFKQDKSHI